MAHLTVSSVKMHGLTAHLAMPMDVSTAHPPTSLMEHLSAFYVMITGTTARLAIKLHVSTAHHPTS